MQTIPSEVWLIILAVFSAYMLIRIEVTLYAIVVLLRQLHGHSIPPLVQEDRYPQVKISTVPHRPEER